MLIKKNLFTCKIGNLADSHSSRYCFFIAFLGQIQVCSPLCAIGSSTRKKNNFFLLIQVKQNELQFYKNALSNLFSQVPTFWASAITRPRPNQSLKTKQIRFKHCLVRTPVSVASHYPGKERKRRFLKISSQAQMEIFVDHIHRFA